MKPTVEAFFHEATWTLTYVVYDADSKDAVIIDPVLDFDPQTIDVSDEHNDKVLAFVRNNGLNVHYVLDTHVHADHLSGFQKLQAELGAPIGIGANVAGVQAVFKDLLALDDLETDGSQWDVLVEDGQTLSAGTLDIEAIATPGHTPACMTYHVGDAVFTGDTMFMPDFGTGRCDFPGGSAETLYDSIQKLYQLPDETRVFVGHDYGPGGRDYAWETTIGTCKRDNKQLKAETTKAEFVKFRTERDAVLKPPKLIFQSLQVNARAGKLPPVDEQGRRLLKLPMGLFS